MSEQAAIVEEPKLLPCPECSERFAIDELARHIERHRPVRTSGRIQCPRGCGRWFIPGKEDFGHDTRSEIKAHFENCSGEPPILGGPPAADRRKEEAVAKKIPCGRCGKPVSDWGPAKASHARSCGNGRLAGSIRKKAENDGGGLSPSRSSFPIGAPSPGRSRTGSSTSSNSRRSA